MLRNDYNLGGDNELIFFRTILPPLIAHMIPSLLFLFPISQVCSIIIDKGWEFAILMTKSPLQVNRGFEEKHVRLHTARPYTFQ